MNILFITTLYPGYVNQSRQDISYALHYFTRDWVKYDNNVKVMRIWPCYPKLFSIFNKAKRAAKYSSETQFTLEGVNIERVIINKYPKIDYLTKDIYTAYKRIVKKLKNTFIPDVIICHMINPSVYISTLLKKEFDKPLILVMHNSDILYLTKNKNRLNRYKNIESYIDNLGFRSYKLLKEYNSIFKENNRFINNTFVITSGISKNDIITTDKLEKKIMLPPRKMLIASNMIPLKNIDIVIKAFKYIAARYNVTLKIAGDGPERQKLHSLANRLDIKNNIQFLGYISREAVMRYMEESDIYVMVSAPETFGLVYIEAMGKGCITIGTKGEGIDGVIKDGENGFLCKPRNVEDLVATLNKIMNLSVEERKKIIIKALDTAKKMSQENLSRKYLDIINQTINTYSYLT